MEWIQRNPRKAVALAALIVVGVLGIIWASSGGDDSPEPETLGGPALATPTATPSQRLTVLPTPSAVPTSIGDVLAGLDSSAGAFGTNPGSGTSKSLPKHRVVVKAVSDGQIMAVGWWIPFANGERTGGEVPKSKTFSHGDTTYGSSDLARILAYGGPESRHTSCMVLVDGKVTEKQSAEGPYAEVFCQG